MRTLRRFFLVSSVAAAVAAVLEVFFAALEPSVVFAGAFEAVPVDAGALPAVEAGLGPITIDNTGQRVVGESGRREEKYCLRWRHRPHYIATRDHVTLWLFVSSTTRDTTRIRAC